MEHHLTAPDTDNRLRHLIGGEWVDGDGPVAATTNPADETVVAEYHPADSRLLDAAVAAAVSARREWDDRGIIARGLVLRRAAEILADRADAVAELMTREQGKTLPESRAEVGATVETLHYHAAQARNADGATFPSSHPDEVIRTVRRPLGVVAAITPWNFPLQIPAWKLAPALLWGNTVVWKPASDTVAVAAAFAEVLAAAGVPAGVLNMVLGPGTIGAELVSREEISGVTFTGSVPVGRSIQAAAVPRGAKVQMELGGHNAAIVLPDVDPREAAAVLIAGAMGSSGQKCTATRRIIAVGDAYDDLVPGLVARVEQLVVGDGLAPESQIGPLVSARAAKEVTAAIDQALSEGAELLGSAPLPPSGAAFVAPTLLAGTTALTISREEVFGPVTLVLRARDLDEAIDLANATSFGLTAAVFTCDERAARRCIRDLDAGLIKVNAPNTGSELHAPFGGLKDSSFPAPREQNAATSAEFFTWSKIAYSRTGTPRSEA
ncbi:aldehyde dehydrogenase family protein [Rhodococcus pseudokoreensis]|uniref:Aldehyde dehydrogenase family protein n=1 Tax=Rhodococcus pseudokoreensis TaxID=2811421 RepID=A0A974W3L1_9NOCA|nr:aldehyde dehydrogenase family protein [Rhodococcus pseudokoreensis]QSE90614.1 aldehyde dehydrogenase family protein [Rhodococcus pseudokoreensis]